MPVKTYQLVVYEWDISYCEYRSEGTNNAVS